MKRKPMTIFLSILGSLAVFVALILFVGERLPREHSASRSAVYKQTPEILFATITNISELPSWRKDVKNVELLPRSANGNMIYRENSKSGAITLEITENTPPARLITTIADASLPFGGKWTFQITPVDGGAKLNITEDGFIKPALFRFLTHYVFGYTATIDTYLKSLGAKFGETITPS
ncbi:MAG: SRPBCC domain-containing protein [Planctomycetota bacterium]